MKKLLALVLAACLLMTVVPAFATVADTVAASENLTHDELVEKAKAEEGTFIVYGNTSRISTAAENFSKLYDIPYESNNLKDAEIYTKLESEIKGSAKGADMVMIQDGAQLTYAIEDGWVVNYVPASVKDTVGESDRNPPLSFAKWQACGLLPTPNGRWGRVGPRNSESGTIIIIIAFDHQFFNVRLGKHFYRIQLL